MTATEIIASHYEVWVGDVLVAIDFEARAVSVTKVGKSHKTEDLGGGFLIDRDDQGRVISVEVIANQQGGE